MVETTKMVVVEVQAEVEVKARQQQAGQGTLQTLPHLKEIMVEIKTGIMVVEAEVERQQREGLPLAQRMRVQVEMELHPLFLVVQ